MTFEQEIFDAAKDTPHSPFRKEAHMDGIDELLYQKALCVKRIGVMKGTLVAHSRHGWRFSGMIMSLEKRSLIDLTELAHKEWHKDRVKEWGETAAKAIDQGLLEPSDVGVCPEIQIDDDDPISLWAEYYDLINSNNLEIDYRSHPRLWGITNNCHITIVGQAQKAATLFEAMALAKKHYDDKEAKDLKDLRNKAIEIGLMQDDSRKSLVKKAKSEISKSDHLPLIWWGLIAGCTGSSIVIFCYYLIIGTLQ